MQMYQASLTMCATHGKGSCVDTIVYGVSSSGSRYLFSFNGDYINNVKMDTAINEVFINHDCQFLLGNDDFVAGNNLFADDDYNYVIDNIKPFELDVAKLDLTQFKSFSTYGLGANFLDEGDKAFYGYCWYLRGSKTIKLQVF